jgi:hypothetical protein
MGAVYHVLDLIGLTACMLNPCPDAVHFSGQRFRFSHRPNTE